MKRVLSLVLATLMIVSLIPVTALTASAAVVGNVSAAPVEGTSNKITLSWKADSLAGGGYFVYITDTIAGSAPAVSDFTAYGYSNTFASATATAPNGVRLTEKTASNTTFSGLQPETTYYFLIRSAKASAWKSDATFASATTNAPVEKNATNIYRAPVTPTMDGVINANEYYLLLDSDDERWTTDDDLDAYMEKESITNPTKKLFVSYDDDYLYLAAQVSCDDHRNQWMFEENGTNEFQRAIFDGHCFQFGLSPYDITDSDEVRALLSDANYKDPASRWSTAFFSGLIRQGTIAISDTTYLSRFFTNYSDMRVDQDAWYTPEWMSNTMDSARQISACHMSHIASESIGCDYIDPITGKMIYYQTAAPAYIAAQSDAMRDAPISIDFFKAAHNGMTGVQLDENDRPIFCTGSGYIFKLEGCDDDITEANYASVLAAYEEGDGSDLDTYEIKLPWGWIDYKTRQAKNVGTWSEFGMLNVRQQQLTGEKTVDGSWYYVNPTTNYTNADTEECEQTVDGTYFSLGCKVITGDIVYTKEEDADNPGTYIYGYSNAANASYGPDNLSVIEQFNLMYLAGENPDAPTDPCADGHTPGDWEVVTPATCTAAGSEVQKCTVCGTVIDTRAIPADGHSYTEFVETVAATIGAQGYTVYKCANCDATEQRDFTSVDTAALAALAAESLNQASYTADSWANYASAKSAAQTVLGAASSTQADVDAAYKALTAAKAALQAASNLIDLHLNVTNVENYSFTLNWDAHPNATKYRIMQWNGSSWAAVATLTGKYSYDFKDLDRNTTYRFYVRGITSAGKYIDGSKAAAGYEIYEFSTANKYELYSSNVTNTKMTVSCDPLAGATKYRLYLWDGSEWKTKSTTTTGVFDLTGLTQNTEYKFGIRGINAAGKYIGTCDEQCSVLKTANQIEPKADQIASTSAKFTWDAFPDAYKYKIYRWNADTNEWDYQRDCFGTAFTATGLTPGVTYTYAVRAIGLNDQGLKIMISDEIYPGSTGVTFTPPVLPKIQNVQATVSGNKVTVTYDDFEGEYYRFKLYEYKDENYYYLTNVAKGSTTKVLSNVEAGLHGYTIVAVDSKNRPVTDYAEVAWVTVG